MLDVAEDLPPIVLEPELVELESLAPMPRSTCCCPAAGSGVELDGRGDAGYLDERPADRDWVLLGCARSRADPPLVLRPRTRPAPTSARASLAQRHTGPLLTKCCLLEDRIEIDERRRRRCRSAGRRALGRLADQVRAALRLAEAAAPAWAPA